jgi:hypothetical protein
MKLERSAYETQPVADIPEAVAELVNAYNRLQSALTEETARARTVEVQRFAEGLRAVINRPVPLGDKTGGQISPYEIGIATEAAPTGRHAITERDNIILFQTAFRHLFGMEYRVIKNAVAERYAELAAISAIVGDSTITGHRRDGDVAAVTYSNGTVIVVNYGEYAARYAGTVIGPFDYAVIRGVN